jgi:hypothetical protein
MAILDELLRATELEIPAIPDDAFWVKLIHALANEDIVTASRWTALSEGAQDWANAGMRAIKTRKAKIREGKAWNGELAALDIQPLAVPDEPKHKPEPEPEPEPDPEVVPSRVLVEVRDLFVVVKPEPAVEPAPAKKKTARRKKAGKKAPTNGPAVDTQAPTDGPASVKPASSLKGKKKQRRATSYKAGNCYWLIRFIVTNIKTMQELDPGAILDRFHADHPNIKIPRGTANTMVYDTISVLRVLRDTGRYSHPMMKEFPKVPTDDKPST